MWNMTMSSKPNGGLSIAIAVMAVLFVANIALIGIPGVFVFIAGDLLPMMLLDEFHGDNLWPIGFYMGVLGPPGIPISYIVAKSTGIPKICGSFPASFKAFVLVGVLYAWVAVLSAAFHLHALSGDLKVV